MTGTIVTFYSWKGGVGRTMALANAATQLARHGKRVLAIDWDLEAPGLECYFFSDEASKVAGVARKEAVDRSGLMGLLSDAMKAGDSILSRDSWQRRRTIITVPPLSRADHETVTQTPAQLHLLLSGHGSTKFTSTLAKFSWRSFFAKRRGGAWLEEFRRQLAQDYDFVLIDSRTGLTDSGGVCTVQMPDLLILVLTANDQSVTDGLALVEAAQRARANFAYERAPLAVVPLLSRWEGDKEVDLAEAWLKRLDTALSPLTAIWLPRAIPTRRFLERLRVPHVARFTFGEPLPVLTHSLTDPDLPGLAYDMLAALIRTKLVDAGSIIDPEYERPFDPATATDQELGNITASDSATEAVLDFVSRSHGPHSLQVRVALQRLATAALRIGRVAAAETLWGRALALDMSLLRDAPDAPSLLHLNVESLVGLGDIRTLKGDLAGALLSYRSASDTCNRLIEREPENVGYRYSLAVSRERLGDVLLAQGDLDEALASYRDSMMIAEGLTEADPNENEWQLLVSISHEKLGRLLRVQGDLSGALGAYRAAMLIRERLAAGSPDDSRLQRGLSVGHANIGRVLLELEDFDGALAAYRADAAIAERLAAADPENSEWQRDLATSYSNIGDVLRAQGDLNGALSAYRTAMTVRRRLASVDPDNTQWQRGLSVSHSNIGIVLESQGDLDGAIAEYRADMAIAERLAAADPGNADWQHDLAISHSNVADLLVLKGDVGGALSAYQAAVAIQNRLVL